MLQWLNTPYTGSGILASAVAMDKILSKHLFNTAGITTPDYMVIEAAGDARLAGDEFGFPLVIKPAGQGSSVGMTKVFAADECQSAVDLALGFGGPALAERCIVGDENTVAVLQDQALPSISQARMLSGIGIPATGRQVHHTGWYAPCWRHK